MSFYGFCRALVRIYYKLIYKIEIAGIEYLPETGGYILCCNHKSNNDPPIVASFMPRRLNFLAKDELFHVPVLGGIIKILGAIPIKRGSGDIAAIKHCLSILKQGKPLLMFPQGTRCSSIKQEDFKPGALPIARKVRVPVIPIGINGEYKFRSKININIGKPITTDDIERIMETDDDKLRNTQLANLLYMRIKELAEG